MPPHSASFQKTYYSTPIDALLLNAALNPKMIDYHQDHPRDTGVKGLRLRVVSLAYSDTNGDGVINTATEVLEESRYYPSVWTGEGVPAQTKKQAPYTRQSASLPFAYNGAEENAGFGLHLTTYRTMAPEVAMWGQVDPKAEYNYASSPYSSMNGNPISYSDPKGDIPFFIFPHVNVGSGGSSVGLEVGIGVPGLLSASATVGAGTGGAYASVQGTAVGFYGGYSTQGGGFGGFGLPIGSGYLGVGYSEAGGWGASAGIGGAPGTAESSIGVGWSQNGGSGLDATVGYRVSGAQIRDYISSHTADVYKSPISNNYGAQNGECALRCFEEFSESYSDTQSDYQYWLNENGGKLGVAVGDVNKIVNGSGTYKSKQIGVNYFAGDVSEITKAFSNDQRVMMGLNTATGGAHAVMVNKVKVWPSGRYRVYFSETSPVWQVPRSTSNLANISSPGFWKFYR